MAKEPELKDKLDPPAEIVEAGLNGELVLFIGSGASMLLDLPSWSGLASHGLEVLRKEGLINYSQIEQLRTLDPRKQLSIAYLIAQENGYESEYSLQLCQALKNKGEGDSIYKAINDIGCPCVTTNYDELLAPRFIATSDGSSTPTPVLRISDREKIYSSLLEPGTVIHLHGAAGAPETMVITIKDYLELYDHENVKQFLRDLFEKKTILFIGYGLDEVELLEHILRRGSAKPQPGVRKRFALQGFYKSQEPLYKNLHMYYEKSFGVHLLGFPRDIQDWKCVEDIIKSWVGKIKVSPPPLAADLDFMLEVLDE